MTKGSTSICRQKSSRIGRRISDSDPDLLIQVPRTYLAIVQVRERHWVPDGVELREWIGHTVLTAAISSDLLDAVRNDPKVIKVEISKPLPSLCSRASR